MRKSTTKRALLMSSLAILLSVSMLVCTTFAWFTDTVSSGTNTIVAGNLDIELYHSNKEVTDEKVEPTTKLFTDVALWEPGAMVYEEFYVENHGNLALKYQFTLNALKATEVEDAEGNKVSFASMLKVAVVEKANYNYDRAAILADTTLNWNPIETFTLSGELEGYDKDTDTEYPSDVFGIIIYWQPSDNDNLFNMNNGKTDTVSIELGVNLFATQDNVEADGFDNMYDEEAPLILQSSEIQLPTAGNVATNEEILTTTDDINLSVALTAAFLNALAQSTDAPESVALSHAEPKIDLVNNTIKFDQIELVDENGEIIDLEAMGNDKPVTVKFNVGDVFNVGDTVIVYHDDEIFATPVVDADKNITYTATHFCEVTVGYNDGKIDTAKEFLTTVFAAEDGDVITLAGDIMFTKDAYSWNSGSWYDGLYYQGDKSFTIDLNGYTITNDSAVNDYLLNFRNVGEKANVITIKNGTVDASSSAYCAICTSSSSTQKTTINLENVKLFNNNSNGSTVKIRGGAELNVKAGTVITGKNSYLAIECVGSTVNVYNGAELYMNGTGSYNGCLAGVCYGGTVNVYGGYGKSVKGAFIAMTSGGTINVYGGEWIANTDGSVGDNSNLYVLTAQSNINESGFVGPSIINVYGGTLRGGMDAWVLNNKPGEKAEINISGGNFNVNPTGYIVDGGQTIEDNGTWTVGTKVVTTADELKAAFNNAQDGDVILIANDITVADKWDNRYGGRTDKAVTIDGLGNTLKFIGEVNDGFNYHAVFRLTGAAIVKNLTFDFSDAAAGTYLRAISASSDLTVDNCTFIGSDNYTKDNAVMFGDTNNSSQIDASVSITNCNFINWRRGVSDNENAKEVKSVVISGNTFDGANAYISVYSEVTFTDNVMDGSLVNITSYTNAAAVKVVVDNNTLDADQYNVIGSASKLFTAANVTAQEGIVVNTAK